MKSLNYIKKKSKNSPFTAHLTIGHFMSRQALYSVFNEEKKVLLNWGVEKEQRKKKKAETNRFLKKCFVP